MNDDIDYMIDVMSQFKNGAKVQFKFCEKYKSKDSEWEDANNPCWDWNALTYRVKPWEPEFGQTFIGYRHLGHAIDNNMNLEVFRGDVKIENKVKYFLSFSGYWYTNVKEADVETLKKCMDRGLL